MKYHRWFAIQLYLKEQSTYFSNMENEVNMMLKILVRPRNDMGHFHRVLTELSAQSPPFALGPPLLTIHLFRSLT